MRATKIVAKLMRKGQPRFRRIPEHLANTHLCDTSVVTTTIANSTLISQAHRSRTASAASEKVRRCLEIDIPVGGISLQPIQFIT
jgi:hypothetical protein